MATTEEPLVWPYIQVLEWVMYRSARYSELYAAALMAGKLAAPITPELLFEDRIGPDFTRANSFEALQMAESSILLRASNGDIQVFGTSPTGNEREIIPASDFEKTHITSEIKADRLVEYRLCPLGSSVFRWKDLLFLPSQIKKFWPLPESNPKGAGRKPHPAKIVAMYWLNSLLSTEENTNWLKGRQKQEIKNLIITKIMEINKEKKNPIPIPKRSTLDSWIDEWLAANPRARKTIGKKWAKC